MVRIGTIASGNPIGIAQNHIGAYKCCPDAVITAVYDILDGRAQNYIDKFELKDAKACASLEELFGLCDAVSICTPNCTHVDLSVQALKAGKHVLCEKPFAPSPQDCTEAIRYAKLTGKVAMIGLCYRDIPGFVYMKQLLDQGVGELSTVVGYLSAFGVPEDHFAVDLTIARGLDYYTGTVYETVMLDHPEIGSICSGGRYDNLAEYYTEKQLPGVGISIGLTRLFFVLEDQGYLNEDLLTAPADALLLPMTEDLSPAIALATTLREAGVRTQIYTEKKKFKSKMNYADKLGIPYVVFLGEDEIAAGLCSVKDMASGEQVKIRPQEAAQRIRAGVSARSAGSPIRDRD